jgi:hypothetical protein
MRGANPHCAVGAKRICACRRPYTERCVMAFPGVPLVRPTLGSARATVCTLSHLSGAAAGAPPRHRSKTAFTPLRFHSQSPDEYVFGRINEYAS